MLQWQTTGKYDTQHCRYHARYFRILGSFFVTMTKCHLAPKYSQAASLEVAPPLSFLDPVS